jgi:hypothetical protein
VTWERVNGILVEGRAQFVTLLSPEGGSLTIINIYAQNNSNEKAFVWRKITHESFDSDHILVGAISIILKKSLAGENPARDKSTKGKLRPGIR